MHIFYIIIYKIMKNCIFYIKINRIKNNLVKDNFSFFFTKIFKIYFIAIIYYFVTFLYVHINILYIIVYKICLYIYISASLV